MSTLPTVAIVGRPNVGKSTLFNRLAGRRIAITEETPGITRDRIYEECEWRGKPFRLVDTGGLDFGREQMAAAVRQQVEFAIEEADVILFVVDAKDGPAGLDQEIAERLRHTGKPVILVANKVESAAREETSREFLSLALGEPVAVSAMHGMEIGTLLDRLEPLLPKAPAAEPWEGVRVAVVGRPNVGKSSLVNALMGEERAIVSPVPGTTRDAIDTPFRFEGENYLLIDTAGIRRKGRVRKAFEYYSVLRALHAIERCHVSVLVVDAVQGLTDQDQTIVRYADEQGRGQVLAVNKWDLRRAAIEQTDPRKAARQERLLQNDFKAQVKARLPFAQFAPVVFISATQGFGLDSLMQCVREVAWQHSTRVPTAALNRVIREAMAARSLSRKGKPLKIYYGTQVSTRPPTIVLFVNNPDLMHFSHQRYLENRIRGAFNLHLTPLRFLVRESAGKEHPSFQEKQ